MSNDYSLEIKNLVKTYNKGQVKAVNDISFYVEKGVLFSFLGINGAGKSTTINIICSIINKDSGKIFVEGHDLDTEFEKIKEEIGVVFQTSVLDQSLTVYQNLKFRTDFYHLTKEEKKNNIDKIIKLLGLEPILKQKVSSLSGGQKRRVDIARAMVHNPKLLILDEPTTGLDPNTRLVVWNLIDKIRKETGMTVLLTTHYLEEAENSSYVVIMDKGNIIAKGTPNNLKNEYANDSIVCYLELNPDFEKKLSKEKVTFKYLENKSAYLISIKNENAKELINKYPEFIKDFEVIKGTMDDVFLNVTGFDINKGGDKEDEK